MSHDPFAKGIGLKKVNKFKTANSRQQLYEDKYAFDKTDTILVNAHDLIDELVEQERLDRENKILRSRIDTLETLLAIKKLASYSVYDIKGRLS